MLRLRRIVLWTILLRSEFVTFLVRWVVAQSYKKA